MEDVRNEQTEVKVVSQESAQQAIENKAEVSLGTFKDVNALLDAYHSLQAEFTKRCQRIKELEKEKLFVDKATPTESNCADNGKCKGTDTSVMDNDNAIKEYLKNLYNRNRTAIVMDGVGSGIITPVNRPKTVRDAGELAKALLNKKEN